MKTTDTDKLMLREFAVESHKDEPSYVTKRRERIFNLLDDFERLEYVNKQLSERIHALRPHLKEPLVGWKKSEDENMPSLTDPVFGIDVNKEDEIKRLTDALKACGISRDNPDTCGVCGLHFADCEEECLVDEVDGTFFEIGFACPGAVARQIVQEKPIEEEDKTQPDWELCRHDILRKRCIACSKDNL